MSRVISYILLFLPSLLSAQSLILQPLKNSEGFDIQDISQKSTGELLVLGEQVLMSFDGFELSERVRGGDNRDFSALCESDGNILIGTHQGELLKSEDQKLVLVGSYGSSIRDIQRLEGGGCLVATEGSGLYQLDPSMNLVRHSEAPLLMFSNAISVIGEVVLLATDQGLVKTDIDFSEPEKIPIVGNGINSHMQVLDDHRIWICEYGGNVILYDLYSNTTFQTTLPQSQKILATASTSDILFVATGSGVYSIQAQDGTITHTCIEKNIWSGMHVDDEGNIWLGNSKGLSLATLAFLKYEALEYERIYAMTHARDHLYMALDSGLAEWELDSPDFNQSYPDYSYTSLLVEGNQLIAGTYNSGIQIFEWDDHGNCNMISQLSSFGSTVLALCSLPDEKVMVSVLGGMYELRKRAGVWEVGQHHWALDPYYVLNMISDDAGILWLGTDKRGLLRYEDGKVTELNHTISGKRIGTVTSVLQDNDADIWLASEELGILRKTAEGLEEVQSPHGSWDHYTSLVAIADGRLLLVGEREVSVFDPIAHELMQYTDELKLKIGKSFPNNFVQDGRVVFFEHHGEVYVYRDLSLPLRTFPTANITGVEVNLATVDSSLKTFREDENNFKFRFRGILFRNPNKVVYSYMLKGFDESWRITRDREATYPRLPPGEYEFLLRTSHDITDWKEDPVSYSFKIKRKFYHTIWFWGLLVLLIGALIYWFEKRRRGEKELRDRLALLSTETRLLNLKSQLNPHFLFNSFNTVIGLIEEDQDRSIAFVEHLTDYYRDVLELGESQLVTLEAELDFLSKYCHLLKERFGDALRIKIDVEPSTLRIPPMTLQLLIENAVKHNIVSDKEPLEIVVQTDGQNLVVRNRLNPRSSVKESLGIGLKNLKQRYEILARREIQVILSKDYFVVKVPLLSVDDPS